MAFTKEELANLRALLNRVTVKGYDEAITYANLMNKIITELDKDDKKVKDK